jgi:ligand-binding SRPBCC domain-containing protein
VSKYSHPSSPAIRAADKKASDPVPHLELTTSIEASPEACFDLSLDVDLHTQSTGAREEIVGGVRSGQLKLGDDVTWKAWHFGIPFRLTSKITEYESPVRFVDEQIRGPFARWRHEHRFEGRDDSTLMIDIVDYRSPLGPLGSLVDHIRLQKYMFELLRRRNEFIRTAATASS